MNMAGDYGNQLQFLLKSGANKSVVQVQATIWLCHSPTSSAFPYLYSTKAIERKSETIR
jgi:hypothetical protein